MQSERPLLAAGDTLATTKVKATIVTIYADAAIRDRAVIAPCSTSSFPMYLELTYSLYCYKKEAVPSSSAAVKKNCCIRVCLPNHRTPSIIHQIRLKISLKLYSHIIKTASHIYNYIIRTIPPSRPNA